MMGKEYRDLVDRLKHTGATLRQRGMPDLATRERMQARVMAYVAEHGGQPARKLTFAGRIGFTLRFAHYLVPPQLAYGVAIFLLFLAGGALAAVSRSALPGERLYPAKLAIEKTQMRFVSNPAERAKVQMDLAGNRLKEIRAITESSNEPDGKVEKTLNHFVQDVQGARANLKQAGDPVQVRAATSELARRAVQYKQELEQTKAILEQRERISTVPPSTPALSVSAPSSPTPAVPTTPEPSPVPNSGTEPQPTQFVITPVSGQPRRVGFTALEEAERALDEVDGTQEATAEQQQ